MSFDHGLVLPYERDKRKVWVFCPSLFFFGYPVIPDLVFGGSQTLLVPIGMAVSVMFPLAIVIVMELKKIKTIAIRVLLGGVIEMSFVFGILRFLGRARLP